MEKSISSIQKQFWAINNFGHRDIAYNIVLSVKINGNLDIEKFRNVWSKLASVLDEHWSDSFGDKTPLLDVVTENSGTAEALIQDYADTQFDLDAGIPVKPVLIKASDSEFYFAITIHHIIIDLHVKKMFSRFISDIYNNGKSVVEFSKYAVPTDISQQEKQKKFWNKYLDNPSESLNLPAAGVSREEFKGVGRTLFVEMNKDAAVDLAKLHNDGEYQQFLVLLSCYAVLLHKQSGQNDFYIGVPFPNRRGEGLENMPGPFVNILPLKVEIEAESTFASVYQYIRRQMLLLHRNQELPFAEILEIFKGERRGNIPYFLQSGFTKEDPFSLQLDGLECTSLSIRPNGAQMDLFFTYWEDGDAIKYRLEYSTAVFDEQQVKSTAAQFELLVNLFTKDVECSISNILIVDEQSMQIYNNFYSDNQREYPVNKLLRTLLKESYAANADCIAIYDNETSLNYNEFDVQVSRVAAYLIEKVGSGCRVAVVMDPSIKRTILIHAIVMAGNSYIPIDTRWPVSRINYIIGNADANLCVACDSVYDKLKTINEVVTVSEVDSFFGELDAGKVDENDNFAVLFTSGSTGEPKGVSISSKGIINRLYWMQEVFNLEQGDRLIHKVPYTFDVSIWELFWPFLFGAALYIPDFGVHLDDNLLADAVRRQVIKYIHFVPSLLRKFLKDVADTNFPNLEGVICSGEALEVPLVTEFHNKMAGKAIHNLYGPTEASIDVTAMMNVSEQEYSRQIPIGFPIANTRIYILDKNNNLCPPYVRGEIAIAGINLAHGYVNNKEQTSRVFITGNWGWGNETVYLTGDLGFCNHENLVYYNGRKDTQVKINGIRIELSEIENQLERLNSVSKAVVLISTQNSGIKKLSAYITAENSLSPQKIHTELSVSLPGYMIPQDIFFVEEFPMTGNGKIDRSKLRELDCNTVTPKELSEEAGKISSKRDKIRQNVQRNRNLRTRR